MSCDDSSRSPRHHCYICGAEVASATTRGVGDGCCCFNGPGSKLGYQDLEACPSCHTEHHSPETVEFYDEED